MIRNLEEKTGRTMVAHMARGVLADEAPRGDDLVAVQYGGGKEALRPIYDAIVKAVGKSGSDVELAPKKAYASLRRAKQFGLVRPTPLEGPGAYSSRMTCTGSTRAARRAGSSADR